MDRATALDIVLQLAEWNGAMRKDETEGDEVLEKQLREQWEAIALMKHSLKRELVIDGRYLTAILECQSRFSLDPLERANNAVAHIQQLARDALAGKLYEESL